jgi:hypothetical protein
MPAHMTFFADHLTLAYHEARNVRHLVKSQVLDGVTWKYLVALSTNRVDAWRELQRFRHRAAESLSAADAVGVFRSRFHVTVDELARMFANPAWRGSAYGGNAWHRIATDLLVMAEAMESDDEANAESARIRLQEGRHNTGTIAEKLVSLDAHLLDAADEK